MENILRRAGAMISCPPHRRVIRVQYLVWATRDDSGDHCTTLALKPMGSSHPKSETEGASGPTKWTSVQQKLIKITNIFKKKYFFDIAPAALSRLILNRLIATIIKQKY